MKIENLEKAKHAKEKLEYLNYNINRAKTFDINGLSLKKSGWFEWVFSPTEQAIIKLMVTSKLEEEIKTLMAEIESY